MDFILPVISAILPFVIWPIERLLPYPHLVEEISKAVFLLFARKKVTISTAVYCGLAFALGESVMYLMNGQDIFLTRLVLTIPLHVLTFVILRFSLWGLQLAIAIHWTFNYLVALLY